MDANAVINTNQITIAGELMNLRKKRNRDQQNISTWTFIKKGIRKTWTICSISLTPPPGTAGEK